MKTLLPETTKPKYATAENRAEHLHTLRMVRQKMEEAGNFSMAPSLPYTFRLKGKPYDIMQRYFPFEPVFKTAKPMTLLLKTARQVSKTLMVTSLNKVTMANGRRLCGHNVRVGAKVLSYTEDLQPVVGRVIDTIDSGFKRVIRITTRMGSVVEAATTHPFRTLYGWTPCGELRVGSRIAAVRTGGIFENRPADVSRIILTAYMIGDGCCGLSNNWNFTALPGKACSEFVRHASRLEKQGVLVRPKADTDAVSVVLHRDNKLLAWLKEDKLAGKSSLTKFIPRWVYGLSKDDTALFLTRLWATDGCITTSQNGTPIISYTSISRRLVWDVRSLLNKFGIPCSISQRATAYVDKNTGEKVDCSDAYVLRVETRQGWTDFMKNFRVPGKPPVSIPDTEENNNRDTLPIELNDLVRTLVSATKTSKTKGKWQGNTLHSVGLRKTLVYALSRKKAEKYLAYFEDRLPEHPGTNTLRALLDGGAIWDEIESIEHVGMRRCWDIEVETEHNYVVNGLLSHNSTSIAACGVMTATSIPFYNVLYVTPLFEQIRRFSNNYVKEFIERSTRRRTWTDPSCVQQIFQRQFKNGSNLFFSYAFLDAERTRGLAVDQLNIDETQNIAYDLIQIIRETMSGSDYGYQCFTGTPKSLDNTIEHLWQDSSQAEWVTKCKKGGCGHWNIPSLHHDLLDMIGDNIDVSEETPGVVCAKCRTPLDIRSGHFLHAIPGRAGLDEGYHIPQIIMPMHYANKVKWATLLGKMAGKGNTTFTTFLNEVLGESFDDGAKIITQSDLKAAAVLPWRNIWDEAAEGCKKIEYKMKIVSVDWGGGGGKVRTSRKSEDEDVGRERTSFTVVTVLGLRLDGSIDVIWGQRSLRTNDYAYEADLVIRVAKRFNCQFITHDYNVAGQLREFILHDAGVNYDALKPITYHSSRKNLVLEYDASESNWRAHISFDKARSLMTTMQCIKALKVRFFQFDYVSHSDAGLISDFLALVEEKTEGRNTGDHYVITRIANKTDDFAQAVNIGANYLWYAVNGGWPRLAPEFGIRIAPYEGKISVPNDDLVDDD